MKVAVINSGSSSIKFKLFDMDDESVIFSMICEEITSSHDDALEKILDALQKNNIDISHIDAVGHRVVHGGEHFKESTIIDADVIQKINSLSSLAPLHNPANLKGILAIKKIAPTLKQYAVFDTSFHTTMPKEAFLYAIPMDLYEKHNIRRYGFHGTSHSYILKQTAKKLQKSVDELSIISLHLGNGSSICVIENGKSIDTSMGFTPLEGLMMGTRSGDIDPSIVLYMIQNLGMSADEVNNILNKHSGLKAIANESDVRLILQSNDAKSKLALSMMLRRIRKYIGGYITLLKRLDAIVFTGGIGENSVFVRDEIMKNLNVKNVFVIKTDEELEIARENKKLA